MQYVTLVDTNNVECGICEKIQAHREKSLHRAFSVFIFNDKGELLVQKRAEKKYHSGNLWSNSCCSHPREGADLISEVKERVRCELGVECKNIRKMFDIIYDVKLGEMFEYEYDHVYFADYVSGDNADPDEVQDVKWTSLHDLYEDIRLNPEHYTYWLKKILNDKVLYFLSINELFALHRKRVLSLIDDSVRRYEGISLEMTKELDYSIKNIGKMKRSYLITVIYYMFNPKANPDLSYLMAAVELMQNASLIHDDIIDKAVMRRGKEAVVKKYGADSAIIMGDFSIFSANDYLCRLAKSRSNAIEIISVLNDAFSKMCIGEELEKSIVDIETSQKLYDQVIFLKTASFFSAVCKATAILAGASDDEITALENYGVNIGIAYQLKDDILPYIDKEMDKDIDSDINQKLVTLPVTCAYSNGTSQVKRLIESWIASEESISAVTGELKSIIKGSLPNCVEKIEAHLQEARNCLKIFKDSTEKRILMDIINNI